MKELLSITSIVLLALFVISCNPKASKNMAEEEKKEKMSEEGDTPKPIDHNAPDQAKIDSIKAAKAKLRDKASPQSEEGGQ